MINIGYLNRLTQEQILKTTAFVINRDCLLEKITVFGKDDEM
jgi:hypothetical protein